jgi:DNA helicase-2/ATP-dependent DNA helicase PcrA
LDEVNRKEFIKRIAESQNPFQLLIAAAGSGKTQTLISLLAERIKSGVVDPSKDHVIVFTFTNNAADELGVRLSNLLGTLGRKDLLNQIYIGTIHGWCNKYLLDKGILANTTVISELERAQILQRVYRALRIDEFYEHSGNNSFQRIDQFLKDLELFYNESLELNDRRIPENVRFAIDGYLKFLKGQRLMDFGFLIHEAVLGLSDQRGNECSYQIYTDEYQDVNPAQVVLIKKMLKQNVNSRLFGVGDPRQSIYQWRGSDVSRILNFRKDFKNAEVLELDTNLRSRQGIVQFANYVADEMKIKNVIRIRPMNVSDDRKDGKVSVVIDTESYPHETSIVELVQDLLRIGVKAKDISILLRSVVYHGKELMDLLDQRGIPFYSPNRNRGTLFVQDFMNSVIDLIEVIHDPPNPASQQEEEELHERIRKDLDLILNYSGEKDTTKVHLAISNWHKEMDKDKVRPRNDRYNYRQQFFDFCDAIKLRIAPNQVDLQEGFAAVTQIMKSIEEAYRRRLLEGFDERSAPVDVFIHNLRWQLNDQLERWTETGMNLHAKDAVTISTVHAAKGLEWPVVITPFVWENRFPTRKSSHGTSFPDKVAKRYGTTREDEKRLWYVAVTRARDRLYIFGAPEPRHPTSEFCYLESASHTSRNIFASKCDLLQTNLLSKVVSYTHPTYFRIGVSDLLLLIECPYHFYLRKISGIEVPVGEELGAGNIMHKIVQRVSNGEDGSELAAILEEEVYLPLAELGHERKTRKTMEAKLKGLIDSGFLESVDLTEHKFAIQLGNVLVTGIIDATKSDGQSIELVDWKYSVHEEYKHRYENQLKIYSYALRELGFNVTKAAIYNLSESVSNPKELTVDISQTAIDNVMNKASAVFSNLGSSGPFTDPNKISCGSCDVTPLCADYYLRRKVSQQ